MTYINLRDILDFNKEEKSRYKNKTHKEACEALESFSQSLETIYEVLLYYYKLQGTELSYLDRFIMGTEKIDNATDMVLLKIEEIKNIVKKINILRGYLIESYIVKSSFGFGCVPLVYKPYIKKIVE